jgi:ribonuclease BN (tRNA processing enzyme)
VKLTVVGCSGSYPGPDSPASCYLLEAEEGGRTWRVLLDLGSGALGALHRFAAPLDVDAVLLSHLHADHCLDLCGYYVMRKYHPAGGQPAIPVFGPDGTAERMARAYDLPADPGMTREFDFRGYDGAFAVGPLRVQPVRVDHPVAAYALRVSHGDRSLVYSGDTAECDGLSELASGADLLLAEASFLEGEDNPPHLHMTGRQAARTAARAGAGQLVLTHIPPWHDPQRVLADADPAYDGPTELARTGATYRL